MVRRRTLVRRGSELLVMGGTIAIAGCIGGDTDSPDDAPDPDDEGDADPDPGGSDDDSNAEAEAAREAYEAAVDAMLENHDRFETWIDRPEARDRAAIDDAWETLETAHDHLDTAEETAPADLESTLEAAARVLVYQEAVLVFHDRAEAYVRHKTEAGQLMDAEQHERARDTYEDALGYLEEAAETLDDIEAVHAELQPDAIDEPALEYGGDPFDAIEIPDRTPLEAEETLVEGLSSFAGGVIDFEAGFDAMDEEDFETAEDRFSTALETLGTAEERFDAVLDVEGAPDHARQEAIHALGFVGQLLEAVELLVEATVEYQAENYETADNLVFEALDTLGEL